MALEKVKDRIITTYKTALEKQVDLFEQEIFTKLVVEMSLKTPTEVIHKFFKDDNALYKQLDNMWNENITHTNVLSNKTSHILIQSLCNYKLTDFIQTKFDFTITKNNNRMSYNYEKYLELCKMEMTFLLNKYDYNLFLSEVRTSVVRILFIFFEVYTQGAEVAGLVKNIWIVDSQDIINVINTLSDMYLRDFVAYKFYAPELKKLKNGPEEKVRTVVRKSSKSPKPKTIDDIKFLFTDDMTQLDKATAVMEYYGYNSIERARKVMNQLGEKRVYKKIKRDIVKSRTDIINQVKNSENNILSVVNDITYMIGNSNTPLNDKLDIIVDKVNSIDNSTVKKEDIVEIKESINIIKAQQDKMLKIMEILLLKMNN